MDFQLTEEQSALVTGVQGILQDHLELPQAARQNSYYFDGELQSLLTDNGYLDTGRDLGALEAALVVIEVARVPAVAEVAATALIAPQLLPEEKVAGPVAILSGHNLSNANRNLPIACTALIDLGDDVAIVDVDRENVQDVQSILAYPFGKFRQVPNVLTARRLRGQGARLRQWWRVGLAAEIAGAAQAAVALTINYVKQRKVFGHPIGAFQVVQHRLVQCHMAAAASRFLALRAAWSGDPSHADMAACYAQQCIKKLVVDLHQFTGAMGVTNEFSLHCWTYRLRALQGEAGGTVQAALDLARDKWNADAAAKGTCASGSSSAAIDVRTYPLVE
jgi:alkylation response protein AidB-like acyl-CoA dehydrogenase